MDITQTVKGVANTGSAPSIVVFLCGRISVNPHLVDYQSRPIKWYRMPSSAPAMGPPLIYFSQCMYTVMHPNSTLLPGGIRQEILQGRSGVSANDVSGSSIIYAVPGIASLPLPLAVNGRPAYPIPSGSQATVSLSNPPGDLGSVVASPQLPNKGYLNWETPIGRGTVPAIEYRLSGVLKNQESAGQRRLFVAGALVGVAGGGLIWLIETFVKALLAAARRSADQENKRNKATSDAKAVLPRTVAGDAEPDHSTGIREGEGISSAESLQANPATPITVQNDDAADTPDES